VGTNFCVITKAVATRLVPRRKIPLTALVSDIAVFVLKRDVKLQLTPPHLLHVKAIFSEGFTETMSTDIYFQ